MHLLHTAIHKREHKLPRWTSEKIQLFVIIFISTGYAQAGHSPGKLSETRWKPVCITRNQTRIPVCEYMFNFFPSQQCRFCFASHCSPIDVLRMQFAQRVIWDEDEDENENDDEDENEKEKENETEEHAKRPPAPMLLVSTSTIALAPAIAKAKVKTTHNLSVPLGHGTFSVLRFFETKPPSPMSLSGMRWKSQQWGDGRVDVQKIGRRRLFLRNLLRVEALFQRLDVGFYPLDGGLEGLRDVSVLSIYLACPFAGCADDRCGHGMECRDRGPRT